jgi:hypothetical protein
VSHSTKKSTSASVVVLAERAHEIIDITELEPNDGTFIGKRINRDGSITQYPRITWWKQRVARVAASVSHLFAYLREARERNICLIRGAPANLDRHPTRRQKAGVVGGRDRRDHGFLDEPTKLTPSERSAPSSGTSAGRGPRPRSCGSSRQRTGLSLTSVGVGPEKSVTAGCACGSCSSPNVR